MDDFNGGDSGNTSWNSMKDSSKMSVFGNASFHSAKAEQSDQHADILVNERERLERQELTRAMKAQIEEEEREREERIRAMNAQIEEKERAMKAQIEEEEERIRAMKNAMKAEIEEMK